VAFAVRVRRGRPGFCRFFAAFRAGDDFFFRAGAFGVFGFSVAVVDAGQDPKRIADEVWWRQVGG
jgi:hypothetical protein